MPDFQEIARQAEKDLGQPQAFGRNRGSDDDGAYAQQKFGDDAKVTTGDDLSTNAGYNKRVPESEGGELDDRGRQARGSHYEGQDGPREKHTAALNSGENDSDLVDSAQVKKVGNLGSVDDPSTQGEDAFNNNLGRQADGAGGSRFKQQYETGGDSIPDPSNVEGADSAQGYEKPDSAVETARDDL